MIIGSLINPTFGLSGLFCLDRDTLIVRAAKENSPSFLMGVWIKLTIIKSKDNDLSMERCI